MRPAFGASRRGTVLVLVLGFITLFMALLAGLALRVHGAGRSLESLHRHVQAAILMQAARIYIHQTGFSSGAVTLGDVFSANPYPTPYFADRQGWVRIKSLGPTSGTILAAGGGSANTAGVSGKPALASGHPGANAYEVRYLYDADWSAGGVAITPRPVGDYASAW